MAYLCFCFNIWDSILKYILEPLKSFLKLIFNTVFGTIINSILVPVLTKLAEYLVKPILELIWAIIKPLLWEIFYLLFTAMLKFLDILEEGFRIFSGMNTVQVQVGGKVENMPLLEAILNHTGLGTILYMVTAIGILLAIAATIFSVIRSTLDLEGKMPLSKVFASAIKSGLTFLLVPMFMYFAVELSGKLLIATEQIIYSTQDGKVGKLSNLIYYLTAKNATSKLAGVMIGNEGVNEIMKKILSGEADYGSFSDKLLANLQQSSVVSVSDMLLVQGIFLVIFLAIVLCMAIFIFISRIFELMLLYIVSPFFSASIPLDEGKQFQRWMNMFIAKVLSGYGIVVMMELYLMVIPYVLDGKIVFSMNELTNQIFSMIFLAGGAYAVYQSSSLLTSIINIEATGMEQSSQQIGAGVAGAMKSTAAWTGKTAWKGVDLSAVGGPKLAGLSKPVSGAVQSARAYVGSKGATSDFNDYSRGNYKGGKHYSGVSGNEYAGTKSLFVPKQKKTDADRQRDLAKVSQMRNTGAGEKDISNFLKDNGYQEVKLDSNMNEAQVDKMLSKMKISPESLDKGFRMQENGMLAITPEDMGKLKSVQLVDNASYSTDIHKALKSAKPEDLKGKSLDGFIASECRKQDKGEKEGKPHSLKSVQEWNQGYTGQNQRFHVDAAHACEAMDYWKDQGQDIGERPVQSWMRAYDMVQNEGMSQEAALDNVTFQPAPALELSEPVHAQTGGLSVDGGSSVSVEATDSGVNVSAPEPEPPKAGLSIGTPDTIDFPDLGGPQD